MVPLLNSLLVTDRLLPRNPIDEVNGRKLFIFGAIPEVFFKNSQGIGSLTCYFWKPSELKLSLNVSILGNRFGFGSLFFFCVSGWN